MDDEGNGSREHRKATILKVETGKMNTTGHAPGIILEGDPKNPEGHTVDYRPASGGRAISRMEADGSVVVLLEGSLDVGEDGEPRVLKVLRNAIRASGRSAEIVEIAPDDHRRENDRGTDGKLRIESEYIDVQIVTFPSGQVPWKDLAVTGASEISGKPGDAVNWLRDVLEHKRYKAGGKLLAIDAAHFGAAVSGLVERYLARYPDPEDEYPFREVWIVGPTARASTFRLGR